MKSTRDESRVAVEDEELEQPESDEVEHEAEVADNPAESETLYEKTNGGDDSDIAEPSRQQAAAQYKISRRQHEDTAEDVTEAAYRERQQIQHVPQTGIVLRRVRRFVPAHQTGDDDVTQRVAGHHEDCTDQHQHRNRPTLLRSPRR